MAVVALGLIGLGIFAYYVYDTIFVPNTNFNNEEATIFITSDATFKDVLADVEPLLKDVKSFEALAKQKKYASNIKGGKYIIKKGMTNNDIINTLRSQNQPIRISFNNQERLENLAGRIAKQIESDSTSLVKAFYDKT